MSVITKLMRSSSREKLSVDSLWIDTDEALERILESDCSEVARNCLRSLCEDGFGVIQSALSYSECDSLYEDFVSYCESNCASATYRDKNGFYDRLASFHLVSEAVFPLCTNEDLLNVLEIFFSCKPKIVGSLFFDKSTEQSIHRDTPTFFTNPLNQFLGVWFALEDIGPNQGPLIYHKGSHKLLPDSILRKKAKDAVGYNELIEDECKKKGLELIEFHPRKGDVLIWHPQLAHGGMHRKNRDLSRHSIVMHWMSSEATIHSPSDFFSGKDKLNKKEVPCRSVFGFDAIDHGDPRFFVNKKEGNFDEF